MATRRMLSKSISYSVQANTLGEFAQLLFSWIIPHLDDFGRISGDPHVIKAMVMPMSKRPVEDFEAAIQEMSGCKLIDRYTADNQQVIIYLGFERHQTGLDKRTKSKLPNKDGSYMPDLPKKSRKIQRNSYPTEQNRTENNRTEPNLTQPNLTANITESSDVADKSSYKNNEDLPDPKGFAVDENSTEAWEAWMRLEPDNKRAFFTTYYSAYKKGLPTQMFGIFASEIEQDKTIINPGAIFNSKVKNYFLEKEKQIAVQEKKES